MAAGRAARRPRGRQPRRRRLSPGCSTPPTHTLEVAYWADPASSSARPPTPGSTARCSPTAGPTRASRRWYALRAAETLEIAMTPPDGDRGASSAAVGPLAAWTGPDMLRRPTAGTRRTPTSPRPPRRTRWPRRSPSGSGRRRCAAAWADVVAGTGAYQPPVATRRRPRPPRASPGPPTGAACWTCSRRRSGQDLDDLWRDSVVTPDEAAELDARADAQLRLRADARASPATGSCPAPIRDALRAWQFETAERAHGRRRGRCSPSATPWPTWPSAAACGCPARCSAMFEDGPARRGQRPGRGGAHRDPGDRGCRARSGPPTTTC